MPLPQTMSSESFRRHRLTTDDYYKMGEAGIFRENDRIELIEGDIIDKAPIGSRHAYTVDKLAYIIQGQISDKILLRIQNPLRLNQHNEPEPDLALVTNKNYSSHHPDSKETLLIIEVADTSLVYDLEIKTALYAQHNVPETWVINLNDKKIHTFRQPHNGTYQQQNACDIGTITPTQVSDLVFDIDKLWSILS